jgi:tetratricopeptide (TPR) repeat protein
VSQALHPNSVSAEALMGEIVDEFLDRLARGQRPDVEEYALRHQHLATVLRSLLPALQIVQSSVGGRSLASQATAAEFEPEGPLGDFRIVAELGRGGMGIVYEAVQISLGRRVALKVLPFAAALDAKQLQRFKNEAQAAANLHHQNIVPVYAVGCERGVHYYAMQFIEGQTLAALIQELRHLNGRDKDAQISHPKSEEHAKSEADEGLLESTAHLADTWRQTRDFPTGRSANNQAFFRTVAIMGKQAAEALEHAHGLGVVHRDVKPANLMMDVRGTLWVTDFGLAQVQTNTRLTMTGDLVGTLRYMSPEQALAQPVGVNHRTDLYSLGATLYELLTLEPPLDGRDRQELLRRIAFEEPKPPSRVNKAVPAELETIVFKAMAKDPAERYATAQELADDLERFLKDEPVHAKRPTLVQRARKWARRNRPTVWSAAAASLVALAVVAGSGGWIAHDRATRQAKIASDVRSALEEARWFQKEGKLHDGQAALRRAEALLAEAGDGSELHQSVSEVQADLQMVAKLEEVRILGSSVRGGRFDCEGQDRGYEAAFREYGIDVEALNPEDARERIRARSIRVELAAALDGWAQTRRWMPLRDGKAWQELLGLAQAADPDIRRTALREAVLKGDRQSLVRASTEDILGLPPVTLVLLSECLADMGTSQQATVLLGRAQEQYPSDFWINHTLAQYLAHAGDARLDEAIPFYTSAVALRPESAGARLNLGNALARKGRLNDGLAAFRKAIDLNPDYAEAHCNVGKILWDMGRQDEAIAALRRALELKPDLPEAFGNLGVALAAKGRLDEAASDFRQAIKLFASRNAAGPRSDLAESHNNLGNVLWKGGKLDLAIAEFRMATTLDATYAPAHNSLGQSLAEKGQLQEALRSLHQALKLKPDYPEAFDGLGKALGKKGQFDEAVAAYRRAIALNPDFAEAHCNLGYALGRLDKHEEAIASYRRAIALRPDFAFAHFSLGLTLTELGRLDEAIAALRHAIEAQPDFAEAHYDLGNALWKKSRRDEAAAAFRRAIALKPNYAEAHCNLGGVLRQQGEFAGALAAMEKGHELGSRRQNWPYPSAQWVRECQRLLELENREQAVLQGKVQIMSAFERNEYAQVLYCKRRYLAATRLWAEAFAADQHLASDIRSGHRNEAAYSAALAAAGQGIDAGGLDEKAQSSLLKLAYEWLRADLAECAKLLEGRKPEDRLLVGQRLSSWQTDDDLAALRDPSTLAKLSAQEQEAHKRFWAEVETMFAKAKGTRDKGRLAASSK